MVALLARIGLAVPVVVSRRVAYPVSGGWKYRSVDGFVAVSRAASAALLLAGVPLDRIAVIPDAVGIEAYSGMAHDYVEGPCATTIVLCAAAFANEKDHRTLLRAWQKVETQEANVRLLLAGDGPLGAELAAESQKLGLRNVDFLGWREDVPSLLQGADIVALSSTTEGFASILCEAQAAGRAIVATRVGGVPEAIVEGETALLSVAGDDAAFARNLLALIRDKPLRDQFGQAGRARARRVFGPTQIADAHAAAYAKFTNR